MSDPRYQNRPNQKFTSADGNRKLHVRWIPGEPRRVGRLIDWNNWDKDGNELITVRFDDTGSTCSILASQAMRITPQIA